MNVPYRWLLSFFERDGQNVLDAKLAELFARAELKRADCRTDWVSGSARPALRGAI